MKKLNVFVVDDDVFYLKSVILGLNAEFSDSVMFKYFFNGDELIARLKSAEEQPDYVLLDYNLDSRDRLHGVELIQSIKKINPKIGVVVVSAQNNSQTTLAVLKGGALSYIQKGTEILADIRQLLNKAIKAEAIKKERKPMMVWMAVLSVVLVVLALIFFFIWKD